jgi:hypothetical protein
MKKSSTSRFLGIAVAACVIAHLPLAETQATQGDTGNKKGAETVPANQPTPTASKMFEFTGGTLESFIQRIYEEYRVDLWEGATIPNDMRFVRVPKIRYGGDLFSLLNLYNQLASDIPSLGHWVVKGNWGAHGEVPIVVVLVAPQEKGKAEAKLSIRAFSLRGFGDKDREILVQMVEREADQLRMEQESGQYHMVGGDPVQGRLSYHSESNILIAAGTDAYVSLAESLVNAIRKPADLIDLRPPSKDTPAPPTK